MKSISYAIGLAMAVTLSSEAATTNWVPTQTKAFLRHADSASIEATTMASPADEQQNITVGLKLRNQRQLDDFLEALYTEGSPVYHQFLTPEQFNAQYAPTDEQVRDVVKYLNQQGFSHINVSPNRTLISADANTTSIERAFNTSLKKFTYNGRSVFANDKPAMVPAELGNTVNAVLGLENAVLYRPLNTGLRSTNHARVMSAAGPQMTYHIPTEYPVIYSGTMTFPATRATIGTISAGNMDKPLSDFSTFLEHNHNLPKIVPTVVYVDERNNADMAEIEWALDSQVIYGASGGLKELIFYTAKSLRVAHIAAAYNAAVIDNKASVVNVSLGICERVANSIGLQAVDDIIFKQAVAQGMTFAASSGDAGPYNCLTDERGNVGVPGEDQKDTHDVLEPASSPYVMAIGGTALYTTSIGKYYGQKVWNEGTASGRLWATGGGYSENEEAPTWQRGGAINARGVPDLVFSGASTSGTLIYVNEEANGTSQGVIGGTSMSSAIFAGLWARLSSTHGRKLGFPNPVLYDIIPTNPKLVSPVSTLPINGNTINYNGWDKDHPGMTATATGWNPATGLGSLNMDEMNFYIFTHPAKFPLK